MRRRRSRTALALITALAVVGAGAQGSAAGAADDATLNAALEAGRAASGAPGATAAIVKDGQVVWSGATGTTAAGGSEPMRPDTLFAIASTTKTVVAAMTMKLVNAGRLRLQTPLSFAEPRLPYARRITVRMLLSHTGGLGDYFSDGYLDRVATAHPDHNWTRAEVLSHVHRPDFPPGRRFEYSNTGYVALGGVIKKAAATPIPRLFQRLVGHPAGMSSSTFAYIPSLSGAFAHPSYQRRNGSVYDIWPRTNRMSTDYWGPVWTDGGLASTSADLARFGNALFAGNLLPRRTVARMLPRTRHGYGFGTYFWGVDGAVWTGHDGDYGGYETQEWTDRPRGVTIAVMTNVEESYNRPSASVLIWKRVERAYAG